MKGKVEMMNEEKKNVLGKIKRLGGAVKYENYTIYIS